MKDKIFMILLGIIAVNLTYQSFMTPVAGDTQRVAICDIDGAGCAEVSPLYGLEIQGGSSPLKVEICGRVYSGITEECVVVLPDNSLVVTGIGE